MPKTALILFAHGARDPEWASPMRRVGAAVRAQSPDLRIELAFLEFMTPNLLDCARTLLAEHYQRIIVLPMFIARGGHLKNDLPQLINELRAQNPQVTFELARWAKRRVSCRPWRRMCWPLRAISPTRLSNDQFAFCQFLIDLQPRDRRLQI